MSVAATLKPKAGVKQGAASKGKNKATGKGEKVKKGKKTSVVKVSPTVPSSQTGVSALERKMAKTVVLVAKRDKWIANRLEEIWVN